MSGQMKVKYWRAPGKLRKSVTCCFSRRAPVLADSLGLVSTGVLQDATLGRVWMEVVQLASTIIFCEEDSLIWKFTSNGSYSSQSLYKIINFRGITPVRSPSIWQLKIPPRVQFFLWLLINKKVLTRDNLPKRQNVVDKTCLFCSELESCQHLFFECVVAKQMWARISTVVGRELGYFFDNIRVCWISAKKFINVNIVFRT
jgi:hypothetical protein